MIEDLLTIEKQKLLQFNRIQANTHKKNYEEDEDFHFLMSLLPHMREIPKNKKLAVRLKIQNVLIEEQTKKYDTVGSNKNNTFTPSTFMENPSIPPITSFYTNQRDFSVSNFQPYKKSTIPCSQTNINPVFVDNTCLSSWENINNTR